MSARMHNLPLLFLSCFLLTARCHPVWDIGDNANDPDNDIVPPEDTKGILDFIDSIISGQMVIKCATRQGQQGRCSIGSCSTQGDTPVTNCPGRLASFLKCCPNDKAAEVMPTKIKGCGVRPVKAGNLIVGGQEAIAHSWPWAIALYRVNNGRKFFQCGGSIINTRYLLSAAHCIRRPFQTLTAKDFIVKVGAHHLDNSGDFMEVEEIIEHENYSPSYHNDDIALLRLKKPLNFQDSHLAPVCLPEAGSTAGRETGSLTTMVGWGVHSQTNLASSPTLYEVQVPISDHEKCKAVYTELMGPNTYLDWNNTLCASFKNGGKDTCQGDSGGGMVKADQDGIYTQIGVVSFGFGCAQPGYPGVYTYVNKYLGWIGSHISKSI